MPSSAQPLSALLKAAVKEDDHTVDSAISQRASDYVLAVSSSGAATRHGTISALNTGDPRGNRSVPIGRLPGRRTPCCRVCRPDSIAQPRQLWHLSQSPRSASLDGKMSRRGLWLCSLKITIKGRLKWVRLRRCCRARSTLRGSGCAGAPRSLGAWEEDLPLAAGATLIEMMDHTPGPGGSSRASSLSERILSGAFRLRSEPRRRWASSTSLYVMTVSYGNGGARACGASGSFHHGESRNLHRYRGSCPDR